MNTPGKFYGFLDIPGGKRIKSRWSFTSTEAENSSLYFNVKKLRVPTLSFKDFTKLVLEERSWGVVGSTPGPRIGKANGSTEVLLSICQNGQRPHWA